MVDRPGKAYVLREDRSRSSSSIEVCLGSFTGFVVTIIGNTLALTEA